MRTKKITEEERRKAFDSTRKPEAIEKQKLDVRYHVEDFDVSDIDPATLLLEGVAPLRGYIDDVSGPVDPGADVSECNEDTTDGYMDLALKFKSQEIVAALGPVSDGDVIVLTITGTTYAGEVIEGQDCVAIIQKEQN